MNETFVASHSCTVKKKWAVNFKWQSIFVYSYCSLKVPDAEVSDTTTDAIKNSSATQIL
jgi:hypothetical protein